MKDKINDFKQFYSQYSIRKSLPAIEQVFTDQDFIEWWDHIQQE